MEKLKKFGRAFDIIAKIAFYAAGAAAIVCLIAAVLALSGDESMMGGTTSVEFGSLEITLAEDSPSISASDIETSAVAVLVSAAVECAFIAVMAWISRSIIAPLKNGEPFLTGISAKIRNLAIVTAVFGTLSEIANELGGYFLWRMIDKDVVFNMANVQNVSYNFHIDLTFVLIAAILYALSLVFRLGEELQRESDETL